jgi:mRNA-degrading endonuclease toxin of MazEF toxin-antitoxin module
VLSPKVYNAKSGLALAANYESIERLSFRSGYFLGPRRHRRYLVDYVKSIDWKARLVENLGRFPNEVIDEVRTKLAALRGTKVGSRSTVGPIRPFVRRRF